MRLATIPLFPISQRNQRVVFTSVFLCVWLWGILIAAHGTIEKAASGEPSSKIGRRPRQILIIAGPITGHGKNTHEYEKSAILLKHLLDNSPSNHGCQTNVAFNGWPEDETLLEQADSIVMISDGGDRRETDHPLYVGDRFQKLETQAKRGCGLVMLHWSTFHPSRYHDKITEWVGGYFDYQKGTATNGWYSAIKHYTQPIELGEPAHPISNGVKPFRVLEEFYYRIRFKENDARLKRLILSQPPGESERYTVGWAVEREGGGRGFGFTGGHYYSNWWDPNFRKLILNAMVWTAGGVVPNGGIESDLAEPSKVLIVTGHNHPAHDWIKTTAALIQVIENDPRVLVDVADDPEFLGSGKLAQYDSLILNYSSWDRPGLSQQSRNGLVTYLKNGGGLSIIHFANGSWTDTLPNKEADWPEYRTKIARRVWVHGTGKSGHDAFGNFRVQKTDATHPITDGLTDFNTKDELYYRQEGPLPIKPLVIATSRDTGKDEPLAWAYKYDKAKVFQTVLGHADVSILMAGSLIRRGVTWASGKSPLSFDPPIARELPYLWRNGSQWTPGKAEKPSQPSVPNAKTRPKQTASLPVLVEGKFGNGLNAKKAGVFCKPRPGYRDPTITVDAWVKLDSARGFNIIAASETKSSLKHWEIYSYANSGELSVYIPGIFGEIRSEAPICDGKWHYIGMTYEKQSVKLFVDGKLVKDQPINFREHADTSEGFAIGSLVEKTIGCDGVIDEVRIRRGAFPLTEIPTAPLKPDDTTLGLWAFDQLDKTEKSFPDQSATANEASTVWKPVLGKKNVQSDTEQPRKITGHWGEDAIGFRWTEKQSEDNRWAFTKHGRFLASTIPLPGGFAEKGLVIKVGPNDEATVCYDLSRLNLMAAWKEGFLEFHQARFGLIRHLRPVGEFLFHNQRGLGWNETELEYRGLYPNGNDVTLEFTIGPTRILETPGLAQNSRTFAITRTWHVEKHIQPLLVPVASDPQVNSVKEIKLADKRVLMQDFKSKLVAIALLSKPSTSDLVFRQKQIWLRFDPSKQATDCKILVWTGKPAELPDFEKLLAETELAQGAPSTAAGRQMWPEVVSTRGVVGEQSAHGFAVDTIRLPFSNPYKSLFFVTGHDWLENGDMVVSTVHGEVWLARGVDSTLRKVEWKRFATGLYQPLGIRVVDNQVYVLCRDQIVRLHDRNRDDEVDFYECFHGEVTTSTGVHDYVCCLETDAAGNFYYIHANDGVVRVSPDGKQKTIVATGFRNPNGLGVRADGLVTAAPQEGQWTPASMVCEVIEGRHYGYRGPKEKTPESPLGYEKPLVYLPRMVDNSSGGQFWSPRQGWGPIGHQLFHLSYGKCTMHVVLRDEVNDEGDQRITSQGAAVPLPFVFESGVCRGRFSPFDGQLYVSGLKGWTTTAVRDGSLQRVRWTGATSDEMFFPTGYRVFNNGIELEFSQPIDPSTVQQNSVAIEAWNYRYSANYGSPEFKVSNPNQQGRDPWLVRSARSFDTDRKLFLEIPGIRPADQVAIKLRLKSHSGKILNTTLYATIKKLRLQSRQPGRPFGGAVAELKKRLQNGTLIQSHSWRKPTLDIYVPNQSQSDVDRVSKQSIEKTLGLSTTAVVQLENSSTRLRAMLPETTQGNFQLSPVSSSTSNGGATAALRTGKLAGNVEIDLTGLDGLVRLDMQLTNSGAGGLSIRWEWSSDEFFWEPIPAESLFLDPDWMNPIAEGKFSTRFLEASQLIDSHRCIRCHDLGNTPYLQNGIDRPSAPDLVDIGSRRTTKFLARKILEPEFESHGGEMPTLFDPKNELHLRQVADLAAYLASLKSRAAAPADDTHSDDPRSTESQHEGLAAGERTYEQLGCIGCHHLPFEEGPDAFDRLSLKYTSAKFKSSSLQSFLRDPHAHAPFRKMGNFALTEKEAGSLSLLIRKYSKQPIDQTAALKRTLATGDAEQGKVLFHSTGCINCHQVDDKNEKGSSRLVAIEDSQSGCLAGESKRPKLSQPIPRFDLTEDQKSLVSYFVDEFRSGSNFTKATIDDALTAIPPWRRASRWTQELRCGVCHDDGLHRAKLPEVLYEEGVLGLAPERLPSLEQIGHKLKPSWIRSLLEDADDNKNRPWLTTRMPSYPGHAKLLTKGLAHQAGRPGNLKPNSDFKSEPELQLIDAGRRLTQASGGLDCLQCHGVGNQPPRGDEKTQIVLGINFSKVKSRLRKDYYDRWMLNPLRIDSQTKMPRYSADGKTTKIEQILNGNARKQFNAIWTYLQSIESE